MKKEFTGPRSHKGWETLVYGQDKWLPVRYRDRDSFFFTKRLKFRLATISVHVRENQLKESNFVSECFHVGQILLPFFFLNFGKSHPLIPVSKTILNRQSLSFTNRCSFFIKPINNSTHHTPYTPRTTHIPPWTSCNMLPHHCVLHNEVTLLTIL